MEGLTTILTTVMFVLYTHGVPDLYAWPRSKKKKKTINRDL